MIFLKCLISVETLYVGVLKSNHHISSLKQPRCSGSSYRAHSKSKTTRNSTYCPAIMREALKLSYFLNFLIFSFLPNNDGTTYLPHFLLFLILIDLSICHMTSVPQLFGDFIYFLSYTKYVLKKFT